MTNQAVMIEVPLAPRVLRGAGVPFEDALWLSRQPPGRARFQALRSPRGEGILAKVRSFAQQVTMQTAIHLT